MFRKILVAHDGSTGARKAFAVALDLAASYGAELHMVAVEEVHERFASTMGEVVEEKEAEDRYYTELKQECVLAAASRGVELHARIVTGHAVESVIRHARDGNYDLLVIGFMGHSRVFDRIWGGTSQNLTRLSPASVLVVK